MPKTTKNPDEAKLRTIAYRILGIRAHTKAKLEAKLQAKGGSQTDIQAILEEMERLGYLDDAQTAQSRIESMLRKRACGRALIKAKLREDGVPTEIAEQMLEEAYPPEKEAEIAQRALEKWQTGPGRGKQNPYAAAGRHLATRGFPEGLIHTLLAEASIDRWQTNTTEEGDEPETPESPDVENDDID